MRKTLHLLLQLFSALPFLSNAQKTPQPFSAKYLGLVTSNAAALGIAQNELGNWRVSNGYYDGHANITYVYLQQLYKGIDIENAVSVVGFRNDKPLVKNINPLKGFNVESEKTTPKVNSASALIKAANALNLAVTAPAVSIKKETQSNTETFGTLGISNNNIPVKLLWAKDGENPATLKLAWQVIIATNIKNALWKTLVNAQTGAVIQKTNLTVYETLSAKRASGHRRIIVYEDEAVQNFSAAAVAGKQSINSSKFNVIPYPYESISYTNPAVVTDPWTQNKNQNANTLKWNNNGSTDFTITRGNNAFVQDDHDNKNSSLGYSPSSSTNPPDLNFNFTPDFTKEPTDTANMNFNFTNLFYWTNLMHDLSYQYGFDEASGNFQASNSGRGGEENDYVIVDAQDGGDIDNANFATQPDGTRPRMQMYLWDPSKYKTLYVNLPASYSGYHVAIKDGVSNKNSFADVGPVTANVVYFNDDDAGTTHTGCDSAYNGDALKGKIAYIDRGACNFTVKFNNAQNAGASAIIVGNYSTDTTAIIMGGTDNSITIPGVMVSGPNADSLKKYLNLAILVNATLYSPQIDGGIDNTIPTHEYTHGISNRLVGGGTTTCLQNNEQMGEGWSDWYALMITQNWPHSPLTGNHARTVGNYAAGLDTNDGGIRTYPYSTSFAVNPWTYDSLATLSADAEEHTIGEVWCEMLWNLTWKLATNYGIGNNIFDATQTGGNNIALNLITQGLKLTSCSPGFVDGRDAILKADTALYGGKYSMDIWRAFAERGLGFSAKQGSSNSTGDGTPAYNLPAVLPVIFSSFTAERKGATALLKWSTAQENNTDKFIVERSLDGKPYTSIGEVKAAGNSAVEKSYSFVDASPLKGENIYHIKEVDQDGKFTLSEVRAVNFNDIKPTITISPNPAANIVTIKMPGNSENLTVRLISNSGQQLNNYILNGETLSINVSKLASGVYNILINGKGYSSKYKLVIQ